MASPEIIKKFEAYAGPLDGTDTYRRLRLDILAEGLRRFGGDKKVRDLDDRDAEALYERWTSLPAVLGRLMFDGLGQDTPSLPDLHQRALAAVEVYEEAASHEETLWTGWGDQVVPPTAEMRRVKAQQALAALRDAEPARAVQ